MNSLESSLRRSSRVSPIIFDQTVWSVVETCRYILTVANSYDAMVCLRVACALEETLSLRMRSSNDCKGGRRILDKDDDKDEDNGERTSTVIISAQLALWTTLRYFYVSRGTTSDGKSAWNGEIQRKQKQQQEKEKEKHSGLNQKDVMREIGAFERRLAASIFKYPHEHLYAALQWWMNDFLSPSEPLSSSLPLSGKCKNGAPPSVPFQSLRYPFVLFPRSIQDQSESNSGYNDDDVDGRPLPGGNVYQSSCDAIEDECSSDSSHPFVCWLDSQLVACGGDMSTFSANDVWKLTGGDSPHGSDLDSNGSFPSESVDEKVKAKVEVDEDEDERGGGNELLASPTLHMLVRCAAISGADSVLAERRGETDEGLFSHTFQLPFLRAVCALQNNPQLLEFLLQRCVIGTQNHNTLNAWNGAEDNSNNNNNNELGQAILRRQRQQGKRQSSIRSELYYHSDLTVLTDALQSSFEVASREAAINATATASVVDPIFYEESSRKKQTGSEFLCGWDHVASVIRNARDVLLKDAMPPQQSQVSDVVAWFRLLHLSSDYSSALQSNAVDGEVLHSGLSVNDIMDMGITDKSDAAEVHRLLSYHH